MAVSGEGSVSHAGHVAPQEDRLHSAGLSDPSSVPRGQDQTHPEFCVPPPRSFMVSSFSLGAEDITIAGKQNLRLKATSPTFLEFSGSLLPIYSLLGSPQSLHQPFPSRDQIHSFGSIYILINFAL